MNERLASALLKLLRPIVRILLKQGVPFREFSDLAKWIYVDIAARDFSIEARKQTDSRISIITGLSRKEVRRVKGLPVPSEWESSGHHNRASRVIRGWLHDADFHDAKGRPASLAAEGEDKSFAHLVSRHSGDVPPRAILDELLRVGAVDRLRNGRLKLATRGYIPTDGFDEKLDFLGTDVAFLANTIDHNLDAGPDAAYFQRKVSYDNLPEEAIPDLHQRVSRRGQAMLEAIDEWLGEQDRDMNRESGGTGRKRAGVGIYFFEEDVDRD